MNNSGPVLTRTTAVADEFCVTNKDLINLWRYVATCEGLQSESDVAKFLLLLYEWSRTQNNPQNPQCSWCHRPLIKFCVNCQGLPQRAVPSSSQLRSGLAADSQFPPPQTVPLLLYLQPDSLFPLSSSQPQQSHFLHCGNEGTLQGTENWRNEAERIKTNLYTSGAVCQARVSDRIVSTERDGQRSAGAGMVSEDLAVSEAFEQTSQVREYSNHTDTAYTIRLHNGNSAPQQLEGIDTHCKCVASTKAENCLPADDLCQVNETSDVGREELAGQCSVLSIKPELTDSQTDQNVDNTCLCHKMWTEGERKSENMQRYKLNDIKAEVNCTGKNWTCTHETGRELDEIETGACKSTSHLNSIQYEVHDIIDNSSTSSGNAATYPVINNRTVKVKLVRCDHLLDDTNTHRLHRQMKSLPPCDRDASVHTDTHRILSLEEGKADCLHSPSAETVQQSDDETVCQYTDCNNDANKVSFDSDAVSSKRPSPQGSSDQNQSSVCLMSEDSTSQGSQASPCAELMPELTTHSEDPAESAHSHRTHTHTKKEAAQVNATALESEEKLEHRGIKQSLKSTIFISPSQERASLASEKKTEFVAISFPRLNRVTGSPHRGVEEKFVETDDDSNTNTDTEKTDTYVDDDWIESSDDAQGTVTDTSDDDWIESLDDAQDTVTSDSDGLTKTHSTIKTDLHGMLMNEMLKQKTKSQRPEDNRENDSQQDDVSGRNDEECKCPECGSVFESQHQLHSHLSQCPTPKKPSSPHMSDETVTVGTQSGLQSQSHVHSQQHENSNVHTARLPSLSCSLCKRRFPSAERLEYHTNVDAKCRHCDQVFTSTCRIQEHRASLPSSPRKLKDLFQYSCRVCGKNYRLQKSFNNHRRQHLESERDTCGICLKTFRSKAIFKNHQLTHEKEKRYLCDICGLQLRTSSALKNHRGRPVCVSRLENYSQLKGRQGVPYAYDVKCLHCNKVFKSHERRAHKEDLPVHQRKNVFRYMCGTCDKTLSSFKGLKNHAITHSTVRPYQCDICAKTFKCKRGLRMHVTAHKKNVAVEKPYQCEICGARFRTSSCCSAHIKIHSDERPYSCDQCGATFKCQRSKRRHVYIHALSRSYCCPLCPSTFKSPHQLQKHKRKHDCKNEVQCQYCDEKLKTKLAYKFHLLKHTGEKPHKCSDCDAAFMTFGGLDSHWKIQHGEKSYKCDKCDAKFARSDYLRKHMNTHLGKATLKCSDCGGHFVHMKALKTHLAKHHKK